MSAFADVRIRGKGNDSEEEMKDACGEVFHALVEGGIDTKDLSCGLGEGPTFTWGIGVFNSRLKAVRQILKEAGVLHLVASVTQGG